MAEYVINRTGFESIYTMDNKIMCKVVSLGRGWRLQSNEGTPFADTRVTREQAEADADAFMEVMINGEDDLPPTPDAEDDPNYKPNAPTVGGASGDQNPDKTENDEFKAQGTGE